MVVSEKQISANRKNAKKSTGPKTRQGKNTIRLNALKHGLFAKDLILDSPHSNEDKKDYKLLLKTLMDDLKPVGFLEETLVYKMVNCIWRYRRAIRAETAHLEDSSDKEENEFDADEFWRQIEVLRNPALAPPKSSEELTKLVDVLEDTRKFLGKNGYISEDLFDQLSDLYPPDEPGMDTLRSMNNQQIDHRDPASEEITQPVVTNDEKAQRQIHMLKLIEDDLTRLETRINKAVLFAAESETQSPEDEIVSTPDNKANQCIITEKKISKNILMYEMRMGREFNRSFNQLLKLQDRRMRYNDKKD